MSDINRYRRFSRREVLKLGGLAAASSLLYACQPKVATPEAATVAPKPEVGGTIDFMSWEGYDLPTCMTDFNTEKGIVISPTYIGDHAEIQAKLSTAQSAGYDLVSYYQGFADLYIEDLKILQPIDASKVPNREKTYELFRSRDFWVKGDTVWGVPFTWGAEGCNYNADKIDPPESWWDLLKPEFKGLVGIIDEMYGNIIMAASAVGLQDKIPNLSKDELAQVKDFLLQVKAQARGIAPSFGDVTDMFVAGEIVATFPGWAAVNIWAKERGANVQHTIPKEGGYAFIDAYAIPQNADNVETALAWINHTLTPEVQACQAANLAAGVVNPDAVALLDETSRSLYDYADLDGFFKKARVYGSPPTTSDEFTTYDEWLAMFEEVKAS